MIIDYKKSAKLNDMPVNELKFFIEEYPYTTMLVCTRKTETSGSIIIQVKEAA